MSGGEGRQDQSLLSLPPCYPSFQGGRSNCICCWLSSTWDACGQGQGVSLALTLSRDDFQGCNQLHIRALRWEGPLHLPQTLLPLSPLQPRRISATALAPGQLDLFSSPPHMRRGSWAYFILMLSSWFPAVFLFPLYRKQHFPIWGRREGVFPARPGFALQPLERFKGLVPASTQPYQSLAGLWGCAGHGQCWRGSSALVWAQDTGTWGSWVPLSP